MREVPVKPVPNQLSRTDMLFESGLTDKAILHGHVFSPKIIEQ